MTQRSIRAVPLPVVVLLSFALVAQIMFNRQFISAQAQPDTLAGAPPPAVVEVVSLGDRVLAAKLIMLWLQAFDEQPGLSLSFKDLDYRRLIDWLGLVLQLDPASQYPLLAASRVYAEVNDPPRQRQMLDFVARAFAQDPERRWPWLAHAVYVAKHRMKDPAYALLLAERLAARPAVEAIPNWARQMKIFVLEEMGELESAKVLLGGLLDSGRITDPHEQRFLSQRLAELEARTAARGSD